MKIRLKKREAPQKLYRGEGDDHGDYHDNMNSVSTCCTSQCDRFANEIVTVLLENVHAMGQVQTVPYVQKEISGQDHDSLL